MCKRHRWAFQLGKLGALGTGLYGRDRKEFVLLRENCQCDLFVKPNPLPRNIGNNVRSYKLPREFASFPVTNSYSIIYRKHLFVYKVKIFIKFGVVRSWSKAKKTSLLWAGHAFIWGFISF